MSYLNLHFHIPVTICILLGVTTFPMLSVTLENIILTLSSVIDFFVVFFSFIENAASTRTQMILHLNYS